MSEIKSDVLIIGAGPSGIFTALELIRKNSNKTITIVEQGRNIDRRYCPKNKTGKCVNCKPYCNITTGFSGAGAFSDGKLSLSPEVGGDLPELIGYDTVRKQRRRQGQRNPSSRNRSRTETRRLSHSPSWHGKGARSVFPH